MNTDDQPWQALRSALIAELGTAPVSLEQVDPITWGVIVKAVPTEPWTPKFAVGDWVQVNAGATAPIQNIDRERRLYVFEHGYLYKESELTWTLGPSINGHTLAPGQQWHCRDKWTADKLPGNTRPLIETEAHEAGDEYWDEWAKHWIECSYTCSNPASQYDARYRTTRPLPSSVPTNTEGKMEPDWKAHALAKQEEAAAAHRLTEDVRQFHEQRYEKDIASHREELIEITKARDTLAAMLEEAETASGLWKDQAAGWKGDYEAQKLRAEQAEAELVGFRVSVRNASAVREANFKAQLEQVTRERDQLNERLILCRVDVDKACAEHNALRSSLAAAQQEVAARQWVSIASAPEKELIDIWIKQKDGDGVRWCDCYYDRICGEWRTSRPSGHLLAIKERYVTHFMLSPAPPLPTPEPREEGERELFEKWAIGNGMDVFKGYPSLKYANEATTKAWQAWQARAGKEGQQS